MTDVRIDSKGKYYTKIVSTQPLEVVVRLGSGERIQGAVHIRANRRLSDVLNDGDEFISITDAIVTHGSEELYRSAYVALNRSAIQWVLPVQAIGEEDD